MTCVRIDIIVSPIFLIWENRYWRFFFGGIAIVYCDTYRLWLTTLADDGLEVLWDHNNLSSNFAIRRALSRHWTWLNCVARRWNLTITLLCCLREGIESPASKHSNFSMNYVPWRTFHNSFEPNVIDILCNWLLTFIPLSTFVCLVKFILLCYR